MKNSSQTDVPADDPDEPIWGVGPIAKAAGLAGKRAKVYRLLEEGLLPAKKVGRLYVSTPRAIRQTLTPGDAA